MFCPEGYVTFCEVDDELYHTADSIFKSLNTLPDTEQEEFCYTVAFSRWAFTKFLVAESDNVRVANSQGVVLKVGRFLLDGIDLLHSDFDISSKEKRCLWDRGPFGGFEEPVFYEIEMNGFTVKPCTDSDIIRAYWGTEPNKKLDEISGWSVCWKPKSFNNWRDELQAILTEPSERKAMPVEPMRPRGKPKLGGGVVEIALQREFQRRLDVGKLALDQRESIYAAAEWVQHIFGHDLPRETARRYLSSILPQNPAQK